MASPVWKRVVPLITATASGAALALVVAGGPGGTTAAKHPAPDHRVVSQQVRPVAHYTALKATKPIRNMLYRYKLPTISSSPFAVKFPKLPPGVYFFSYALTASGATANDLYACSVQRVGGTGPVAGMTYSSHFGSITNNNGSGMVDTRAGGAMLFCNGIGSMNPPVTGTASNAATVSFLRADGLVAKSGALLPPKAKR